MTTVLITGGARSGKSRYAESVVLKHAAQMNASPIFIATAEALDAEMEDRIAIHKSQRDDQNWRTVEAPLALADAISTSDRAGPRLVDCLTLWLSNVMHTEMDWKTEADALCDTLNAQIAPVVIVTNEVGLGIVPENALARRYRDNAGLLNQMIAKAADEVIFTVSGLPVKVK